MAVVLRLARHGKKHKPFYRIVACESDAPRDGRFIEIVGTYNPMCEPPVINLKEDRVRFRIEKGAKCTSVVEGLVKKQIPNLIEEKEKNRRDKIQSQRKARKQRATKKAA